jgi:hypothetical protein
MTLGGKIRCPQCQATSKRTRQQCKAPAIKGKTVCRFHGGRSTGPKTSEGRRRCAEVKIVHGEQTSALRTERRHAIARLALLESIGWELKMMAGPKTPGRKPTSANAACPELVEILKRIRLK